MHGLATIGWDDEGVAAQTWDLVRDGVLVGYQLDRHIAAATGSGRSNGCAFADSPLHVPIQRMSNVSLQPVADGPSTEELIAGVDDGTRVRVLQATRQGLGESRQIGLAQHLAEIPWGDGAVSGQHPDAASDVAVFVGVFGRPVLRSRVLLFGHLDPQVRITAQLVRAR